MKKTDKDRYSTITISDDDEIEEKSFIAKTLEIPKIILTNRVKKQKKDYFNQAERYNPTPEEGLNAIQVDERINHELTNKQAKTLSKSYFRIIFDNVFTFFNILLFTIGICLLAIGDYQDCFFLLIIGANLAIGIIQEIKSKKTVDKLSLMNVSEVKVRRDGVKIKIKADQLVLDDIFYLTNGNEIPADAYIVKGEIEVNESALTGESLPVKKTVEDYVLAGSFVVSGTCLCRCDRIGEHNYVAQLQNKARKVKKVKSVILYTLNNIIKTISMILLPVAIALIIKFYSLPPEGVEPTFPNMMKNIAASIISMIPSGLFLMTTTTLALSVVNLGQRKTMVQDSYAIESLARSNIICLDKTGTITDGTMRLEKQITLKDLKINIADLMGSYLAAFDDKNVTSIALGKAYPNKNKFEINVVLPFSSARKLSAVQFNKIGTFVLGAPEFITKDENILKQAEEYTLQGYRVLLLGKSKQTLKNDVVFKNIDPISLFVLSDHIRDEAYDTIKWFNENDVEIKIISGDNPITVSQIAKKAGVINHDKYISLDGLSNDEVSEIADKYTVFGRVSPEQKAVLIKTLKNKGNTVAMTGDGVNDILAMKQANCSIAMASGSDAARNSSHLVLMDSNFASMPKVVEEGRKVINNIQRYSSLFLMKTTYAVLMNLLIIVLWFFNNPFQNPLQPAHLYILEFFVIGIPPFLLAMQPNYKIIKGDFIKNVLSRAFPGGIALFASLISLVLLKDTVINGHALVGSDETLKMMGSLMISFVGLSILIILCQPFTKYTFFVCLTMVICAFGYSFIFTWNSITSLTLVNWLVLLIILVIAILFYLLVGFLFYLYSKKHEETKLQN